MRFNIYRGCRSKPLLQALRTGGGCLEKNRVKHGFMFLGQTFRKHVSAPVEALFKQLNSVLREPPHKLEKEAFNAKKFASYFKMMPRKQRKSYVSPKMATNREF
ncbi:MAG: hypothetical protein SCABRO_01622 [Candidatus Scalindua brodae]|uniref:Uncharacterized protein n=1 Tax=Candidatus Scalindua brodae TaxID=237368 RepID=A0A0B0EPN8_9BACT|nr:MAG: hypothetical protein SCABRO_01622 [Candidatus Scalindua brodae]